MTDKVGPFTLLTELPGVEPGMVVSCQTCGMVFAPGVTMGVAHAHAAIEHPVFYMASGLSLVMMESR